MNFVSLGSGSIAASGILETEYQEGLSFEEAKALAVKAISAGIIEDLGSGSQVDVVQITRQGSKLTRGVLEIGRRETEKLTYDLSQKKIRSLASPSRPAHGLARLREAACEGDCSRHGHRVRREEVTNWAVRQSLSGEQSPRGRPRSLPALA